MYNIGSNAAITELITLNHVFCVFQIQRMVISGGNFKPDTLKPKEVVSLLLDDEELEKKCEFMLMIKDSLGRAAANAMWLM